MGKTKFTVRVDAEAFKAAKEYAGQNGTTVTNLVEAFFRSLGQVKEIPLDTPVLSELAGSLNPGASVEDYEAYLKEKYLGSAGNKA